MKNTNRLVLANIFALVAIVTILTVSKMLGLEVGLTAEAIVPNALLVSVPQIGFIYFYITSTRGERKKVMA
jgi:hypothetical protein